MTQLVRKKLTRAQGFSIIEEFNKSGLTPKQFCSQQNLTYYVFQYWRSKSRKQGINNKRDACFLPVKLNSPSPILSVPALKISLKTSISVEIPSGFDKEVFRQILEVCNDVVNR